MPIHVEELLSEVTVFDGELPFTETQVTKLVALVAKRLAEQQRAVHESGRIPRRSIIPALETRG
jgi:hypothetical protein